MMNDINDTIGDIEEALANLKKIKKLSEKRLKQLKCEKSREEFVNDMEYRINSDREAAMDLRCETGETLSELLRIGKFIKRRI